MNIDITSEAALSGLFCAKGSQAIAYVEEGAGYSRILDISPTSKLYAEADGNSSN